MVNSGSRRTGMVLNTPLLEQGRAADSIFVFLHCQRTGGSNFQRWLGTNFAKDAFYSPRTVDNYVRWHQINDVSILGGKRLVSGFSQFKEHELDRAVVFLANVRHPVYRIISLVNLARLKPDHFLHDLADKDLATFYREGRARKPHYFDNLQTLRLAGAYDADLAIENVRTKFAAVGTTDELAAMSQFLTDYYNWHAEPLKPFDGPPDEVRYAKRINPQLFEEISNDNAFDVKLYEFVRTHEAVIQSTGDGRTAVHQVEIGKGPPLPADAVSKASASGQSKTHSIPLSTVDGVDRIVFAISVPDVPEELKSCYFAEHVFDFEKGQSTDQVIMVGTGRIGVSDDLGANWRCIEPPDCQDIQFHNCFTTHSGRHIVQTRGWNRKKDIAPPGENHGKLFLFSPEWQLIGVAKAGDAEWHGSASIAEKNGIVMYADYHNNRTRHEETAAADETLRACGIWRSFNEGMTWEKVFEQSPFQIRHFHTLMADPFEPDVWWASSGDVAGECRIWKSPDNGSNWIDCTQELPDIDVPENRPDWKRAAHRLTDMAILEDTLIWGADDLMGTAREYLPELPLPQRSGARIYRTAKSAPLTIEEVGYVGQPVRSMIDVDEGWILTTEAKNRSSQNRASFYFLDKNLKSVIKLCDADNHVNRPTGLTSSKASRKMRNRVFFSYKQTSDLFGDSPRIARYEVTYVKDK